MEVDTGKALYLWLVCGLAIPSVALAQDDPPEAPKIQDDTGDADYVDAEPEEDDRPFLDGLSWQVLASGFYNFNGYRVSGTYNNLDYPYTNYMGFGLNFAGGDVTYTGHKFAIRLDLRWGTAAELLTPIAPVKQGYVAYMPTEHIAIDFGFFDTMFGGEFVDEWVNANYTRGALYFLRQPFNHLGVRLSAEPTELVGFTFMLANGGVRGGTAIADVEVPAVGWQVGLTPRGQRSVRRRGLREGSREVGIFFGGNHAPSGINGNRAWESFFDVLVTFGYHWFHFVLNADYQINPHVPDSVGNTVRSFAFGHSLALIFDAADHWSVGLRGENLSGNDAYRTFGGDTYGGLTTGTVTVRYKPVEYLVISLEGRGEWTTRNTYFSRSSPTDPVTGDPIANQQSYYALILGVSGHIGN
ncbi:MAG: outer membrane beta-barrel protein [Polyangiales bacterium]